MLPWSRQRLSGSDVTIVVARSPKVTKVTVSVEMVFELSELFAVVVLNDEIN